MFLLSQYSLSGLCDTEEKRSSMQHYPRRIADISATASNKKAGSVLCVGLHDSGTGTLTGLTENFVIQMIENCRLFCSRYQSCATRHTTVVIQGLLRKLMTSS